MNYPTQKKQNMAKKKKHFSYKIELPGLLSELNRVYNDIKDNGLRDNTVEQYEEDFGKIRKIFNIGNEAVAILSLIARYRRNNTVSEFQIAEFLGCSDFEMMEFEHVINDLIDREIISAEDGEMGSGYYITKNAFGCIRQNKEYESPKVSDLTPDEFFSALRVLFRTRRNSDAYSKERLLDKIFRMVSLNPQLVISGKLEEMKSRSDIADDDILAFVYICHRYVSHGQRNVPVRIVMDILDAKRIDDPIDISLVSRIYSGGTSVLHREGLVKAGEAEFFVDTDTLSLTEKAVRQFLKGVTQLSRKEEPVAKCSNVIENAQITPKQLFYNPVEQAQMDRLASLLDRDNFENICKRLESKGMRKGFAVLFSGGAGCGKTAGVLELARRSGRDIFKVDMSQIKNKYVGESEKNIQAVFDSYRDFCNSRPLAPILLFNEADAIFMKRLTSVGASADQMMNSIQNICLDAIENLEGILVATTNLSENFCDDAFLRRFIYKINFTTPDAEVRGRIWKSMLPSLDDADAALLGSRYNFSGGNIENVVRKASVEYILAGKEANLGAVLAFCDEEQGPRSSRKRIGF